MFFNNNLVNRNGIATLDSNGINVSTDAVTYTIRFPFDVNVPFRGLVLVRLNEAIPEGTTGTLPIKLTLGGFTQNVTTYNGDNLTVADLPGTGIYLLYYNRFAGILQLIGAV
jgi:hypothetical protein